MLSVMDIVTYVNTLGAIVNPVRFFPNEFTTDTADNLGYVRLYGGFTPSEWTDKRRPSFQIVIRTSDIERSESVANQLYAHFRNRREFAFGETRVISCEADQSAPLYLGRDGSNRFLYSVNFTFTTI